MLIGAVWTAARLKTTVPWRGPCMTDRLQIPHRVTKKPGRQTYVHEHTHTHRESWSLRSHLARQADGTDFEWSLPQILTAPRGNKPTPPGVHCTDSPGTYAFSLLLLGVISQYSKFASLVPSLKNCDGMSCHCLLHSDRGSMKKYDWINLLSTRRGENRWDRLIRWEGRTIREERRREHKMRQENRREKRWRDENRWVKRRKDNKERWEKTRQDERWEETNWRGEERRGAEIEEKKKWWCEETQGQIETEQRRQDEGKDRKHKWKNTSEEEMTKNWEETKTEEKTRRNETKEETRMRGETKWNERLLDKRPAEIRWAVKTNDKR